MLIINTILSSNLLYLAAWWDDTRQIAVDHGVQAGSRELRRRSCTPLDKKPHTEHQRWQTAAAAHPSVSTFTCVDSNRRTWGDSLQFAFIISQLSAIIQQIKKKSSALTNCRRVHRHLDSHGSNGSHQSRMSLSVNPCETEKGEDVISSW